MKLVNWRYFIKYVCRLALTGDQAYFKPCLNASVTEVWDVSYLSFFYKLLADGNWIMTFESDWNQLETCQTRSKGTYLSSMLFWNKMPKHDTHGTGTWEKHHFCPRGSGWDQEVEYYLLFLWGQETTWLCCPNRTFTYQTLFKYNRNTTFIFQKE